uniref:Uncharacterized protein n=1 Tax=Aegilops tauschii TaxID=37682 RepID=M8C731_AEGTA
MADKPSRALVLYAADHAALLAGGGGGKGQLDAFASIASCGFLSVRTPAVNEDGGDRNSDSILELAQLLDVYDALYPAKVHGAESCYGQQLPQNHHPMLLAQWQQGVTRSDLAKEFSFEEFMKVCDRFIARKLVQRFYDKALAFGLKGYAKLRFMDFVIFENVKDIKACGGDADGRREVRGLDGVVAADGFLRPLV